MWVVLWLALSLLAASLLPGNVAQADDCQFRLGFKTLHDLIPAVVGDCLVDEHHNPTNGDGLQETTGATGAGGLLVWRKADNFTAFTDGYRTWINGPFGLQTRLNGERFDWEVAMMGDRASEWARAAAASELGVGADAVVVQRVEPVDWPDASLGCPRPGMMYAQVITPG